MMMMIQRIKWPVAFYVLIFTKVFRSATGLFNKTVLQLGKMKITNDNFGMFQAIVVNKILQLEQNKITEISPGSLEL